MIEAQIKDQNLITHLNTLQQDSMTIFTLAGNTIRGAIFHATNFVNKIKIQHNLGILESYILGQAGICTALIIPTMKGRDRAIFRYDTRGPIAGFSMEAFSEGWVRGYLFNNPIPIAKPLESWDLQPFLGDGLVTMVRFPEGAKEPITGTVQIMHQNIPMDLAEYFLQSEQTKTAFNTGIKMDSNGMIIGAGGMYLQVMPGADENDILTAERAFSVCPSLGEWFSDNGDIEDLLFGLFRELNPQVLLTRDIKFFCPCTSEKFYNHLHTISNNELKELCNNPEKTCEIYCHNCSSVYTYTEKEIQNIIYSKNR